MVYRMRSSGWLVRGGLPLPCSIETSATRNCRIPRFFSTRSIRRMKCRTYVLYNIKVIYELKDMLSFSHLLEVLAPDRMPCLEESAAEDDASCVSISDGEEATSVEVDDAWASILDKEELFVESPPCGASSYRSNWVSYGPSIANV